VSEEPKTTVSDYIKALFTMADNMEQPCEQAERQRVLVAANELKAAWERERVEIAVRAATDAVHLTNKKWMRDCANVAKLREALEVVLDECCHHLCAIPDQLAEGGQTCDWCCVMPGRCEAIDKAKAALAAPVRNCDLYATWEDAVMAWNHRLMNFGKWLFAKADETEGGQP
jgi:hypothetical protein